MDDSLDLVAVTRASKLVREELDALKVAYHGRYPDNEYWKRIVQISAHFFAAGAMNDGVQLLTTVLPEYIRTKLLLDLAADAEFAESTGRIADKLVATGMVKVPAYETTPDVPVAGTRVGEA